MDIWNLITGEQVFIIAELSANHNHDINIAKDTILAIKKSGADAVKIQTYTPDTMTIDCDSDLFKKKEGLWKGKTLYELYSEACTPLEWQGELKEYSENLGLIFFSSPFDIYTTDFLSDMDVPAYKIASFEITDIPLISHVASKGKPVIISTGIATEADIELALETCRQVGNNQIALLKCTSAYPTPVDELNLKTIADMKNKFKVPIGLSDHSLGMTAPVMSVAYGGTIIEKHFILNRDIPSPDMAFSMEPHEFSLMVEHVREAEKMQGEVSYELTPQSKISRKNCRSLFVVKDIKEGEIFSTDNIKSIRPGNGLAPKYYDEIMGRKASKCIRACTPLSWDLLIG